MNVKGIFKAVARRLREPSSAAGPAAVIGNVAGLAAGSVPLAVAAPAVFLGVLAVFLPESATMKMSAGG